MLALAGIYSADGYCANSYAYELRTYEGNRLDFGGYGLVYWCGTATYPSRLYIKQGPAYLESWLLNSTQHSLSQDGQTIFNLTLLTEGFDDLVGQRYALLRVEADWDVAQFLTVQWYDLPTSGETITFDLSLSNPSCEPLEFWFKASSATNEIDVWVDVGGIEVVGPWHAEPKAATSVKVKATPSKEAPSGIHELALSISAGLDAPVTGSTSHIYGLNAELDLYLHLTTEPEEPTISTTYTEKAVEAGETAEFEVKLTNELEERIRFSAEVILPEGLAEDADIVMGGVPTSIMWLDPKGQTTIKIIIQTSPNAPAGRYEVSLLVTCDDADLRQDFYLDVTDEISLCQAEIDPSTTKLKVDAGQEVHYEFSIKNTGKLEDTYVFSLNAPEGWSYTFTLTEGSSVDSVTLEPGQREDMFVTITSPTGVTGDKSLVMSAESGEWTSEDVLIEFEITAPDPPSLSVIYPERIAAPGEIVQYDLEFSNPGPDAIECYLDLEIPGDLPAEVDWSVDGNKGSHLYVEGGVSVMISVTVHVDSNAPAQRQSVQVKVSYSSVWLGEDEIGSELVLEIQSTDEYVELISTYSTMNIEAGQEIEFESRLTSMLLDTTTFKIDLDVPDGLIDSSTLTINGKQTDTVTLEPENDATIHLMLTTLPEADPGIHNVLLTATWGVEGSSTKRDLALILVILDQEPLYDVQVDIDIPHILVQAGQQASYACSLSNTGKLEDEYTLYLTVPDGWDYSFEIGGGAGATSGKMLLLSPGGKTDISICVIPTSDTSGTHQLDFSVSAASGGTESVSLVMDVEPSEAPRLSSYYLDKVVETGESLQFDVDLVNPSTQAAEFWLELRSNPPLPGTFEITVEGQKATHFILEGGSTSNIRIAIDTLTNATIGTYDLNMIGRYIFEGEETGESGRVSIPLAMVLEATIMEYSLEAYADYPSQTIVAGDQGRFTLTLSNTGKIKDTYAWATNVSASWTARLSAGNSVVRTIQLEVGQTLSPVLTLTSPLTETGEVAVEVQFESQATGVVETFLVYLNLEPSPDLEIVIGNLYLESKAGEKTSVEIDVRNPGNTAITNVQLQIDSPEEWGVEYSPLKITEIAPGGRETITMSLTSPSTTPRGDYSVSINAQSDQVDTEEITLRVSVGRGGATGYFSLIIIVIVFGGLIYFFRRFGRR